MDEDLRKQWKEVADNLVPYPVWQGEDGPMFCAIEGIEPHHIPDVDHFGEAAQYPVLLSDDITLDSPKEQKDMMLRTIKKLSKAGTTGQALTLMGIPGGKAFWNDFNAETLLNSRSGRIHLFPAVEASKEVAFKNFQAKGAFLVSAAKDADKVYYVKIESRSNRVCKVMNPWNGKQVTVVDAVSNKPVKFEIDRSNGE